MTVVPEDSRRDWAEFFAADGRFDVAHDPARYRRVLARNLRDAVVLALVVVLALGGAIWWARPVPIVLATLLAVVGGVLVVALLRRRTILRRRSGGTPGLLLGISNAGVHTPTGPAIPWHEVVGVFAVDESARVDAARRAPGVPGAAQRWAARNGRATRHLWFVLADAAAVRSRMADPRWRKGIEVLVTAHGPALGSLVLDLDAWTTAAETERVTSAALVQAEARGIRASRSTGAADWSTFVVAATGTDAPELRVATDGNPFRDRM